MASHIESGPRRTPQQERGQQRVTGLLDAAASVIADAGYDAATMSEIAVRAGACIGSLYQFFPNKASITEALREHYSEELRALWASLDEADCLDVRTLAERLVDETVLFLNERPALLELLVSPCNARDASLRDFLRERLARILRKSSPHLSKKRAALLAAVALQMMKGMNEIYAESSGGHRKIVVKEYERVLTCYLQPNFEAPKSRGKGPNRK